MTDTMSVENPARTGWNSDEGRKGLRVALAVAVGFTWSVASGAIVPFLGPVFAAQFLLASDRPMPLGKVIAMLVLIFAASSVVETFVAFTGDRPIVITLVLALVYFPCFYMLASGKGGPVGFVIIIIGIMGPLLGILNRDLGESVLSLLLKGVLSGAVLMWFAHAILPSRATAEAAPPSPVKPYKPGRLALANTVILLLAMVICLSNDALSTSIVIPITVASLLNQLDVASSGRAAIGIVLVNLLGGILACVAFTFLEARHSVLFLFLTTLVVGLLLGGNAARSFPAAKVFAGTQTMYLVVLGLSLSPLPGTAGETFSTRIFSIMLAIAYVLTLAPILWPRRRPEPAMP